MQSVARIMCTDASVGLTACGQARVLTTSVELRPVWGWMCVCACVCVCGAQFGSHAVMHLCVNGAHFAEWAFLVHMMHRRACSEVS
jgi:hypothetical protein